MNTYRTTAHHTRAIDAMAEAMRKRQRKLGKGTRKALIARAATVPLTDNQREAKARAGKGAGR